MPDINYFYIDEAGDLNDQSKYFLIGCIITDSPDDLLKEIGLLEMEIKNRGYFNRFRNEFLKTGFHASTNHPDIYSQFVALLPRLNFRYYALILDKRSDYYLASITSKSKEEVYDNLLKSLLKDRLLKRIDAINKIFFEQNLPNPTESRISMRGKQLASLISGLNNEVIKKRLIKKDLRYEVRVQNKKTQPLFAIVDFMNHIVMKVYEGKNNKVENYMKENYRLVEPKIGCIHDFAHRIFHKPRKKGLDIDSIFIGC
jgi:hypothetical protein